MDVDMLAWCEQELKTDRDLRCLLERVEGERDAALARIATLEAAARETEGCGAVSNAPQYS